MSIPRLSFEDVGVGRGAAYWIVRNLGHWRAGKKVERHPGDWAVLLGHRWLPLVTVEIDLKLQWL